MTATREILTILTEECAEVIQSVSKIQRFGWDSEWANESNQVRLERELGDLLCMIDLLVATGAVERNQIENFQISKREKLKIWSSIL